MTQIKMKGGFSRGVQWPGGVGAGGRGGPRNMKSMRTAFGGHLFYDLFSHELRGRGGMVASPPGSATVQDLTTTIMCHLKKPVLPAVIPLNLNNKFCTCYYYTNCF